MSLLVVLITSKGKQLFLPREWACQFVELWSCTCVCGCMKERACSCGFMYAYLQEVYTEVVNRLAMYVCKIHTTFQSCITANGNSCWTLMWSTLSFFFFLCFHKSYLIEANQQHMLSVWLIAVTNTQTSFLYVLERGFDIK